MDKSAELARHLVTKIPVEQGTALHFLNVLQEVMIEELRQNGIVKLKGFGRFAPWKQTERPGRNPRTGDSCIISARISVKFKPGKELLNRLNDAE